jgi:protein SCO1/2
MLFKKWLYFTSLIAMGLSGCASPTEPTRNCCRKSPTATVQADIPDQASPCSVFDLNTVWQTDQKRDFRLPELRGHLVIISMFYASCEGVCVITKEDLKAVEASLPVDIRSQIFFVLVTLAPNRDSARVLRDYRAEQGLSATRWLLLRGSDRATAELARLLKVGYGIDHSGLFRHGSEITVLDKTGTILLQRDGVHADLAAITQTLINNYINK